MILFVPVFSRMRDCVNILLYWWVEINVFPQIKMRMKCFKCAVSIGRAGDVRDVKLADTTNSNAFDIVYFLF